MKLRKVGSIPAKATTDEKKEQIDFLFDELIPKLIEAKNDQRKVYFVDVANFVRGAYLCSLWC